MQNLKTPKVVLVTGCSSGIGLALARKLWDTDYCVMITARVSSLHIFDNEKFEINKRFHICSLDVTNPADQIQVVETTLTLWGRIDVLVNNAGISFRATAEQISQEEEELQFATNYFGPINLTRLVLPTMRRQKSGHIINVSSVGGMMAMPTMSSYSASKFALEGASEALWYEMRPWNIFVSLIQPGFIHSDSFLRVVKPEYLLKINDRNNPYQAHYDEMNLFVEKLMKRAIATPESVANIILRTIRKSKPPLRVQATLDAWFFAALRRFLPRRWYHKILYRFLPNIKKWGRE